jgi:hypothetical protein
VATLFAIAHDQIREQAARTLEIADSDIPF